MHKQLFKTLLWIVRGNCIDRLYLDSITAAANPGNLTAQAGNIQGYGHQTKQSQNLQITRS
jgi:hypothetical protein